jgi:hypothetical protein
MLAAMSSTTEPSLAEGFALDLLGRRKEFQEKVLSVLDCTSQDKQDKLCQMLEAWAGARLSASGQAAKANRYA